MKKSDEEAYQELALVAMGALLAGTVILFVGVAWPTLVWSTLHLDPTVVGLGDAVGGAFSWLRDGASGDPRAVTQFAAYRDVMPSPAVWIALNALLLLGGATLGVVGLARVDRWRGSSPTGLPRWNPRSWVTPRAWARPRDLLHLQPPAHGWRRFPTALKRLVLGERRAASGPGGDSWPLGTLRRRPLRSARESHLMAVAPTRSGKTTRVLVPALLEHDGPAVVLLNKTEVVNETYSARAARGPVWIYAPRGLGAAGEGAVCGWTPLLGCEQWEHALLMGRWLLDADPSASASSNDNGGARFYNREATGGTLPALLHAAALDGRPMAAVRAWLQSGVDGLDEPRAILLDHSAHDGAASLAGVQAMDERPQSLLLMSAAQLVDAYRFPSVAAADRPEFQPEDLLDGGTLYVLAPDSDQELLAPLFGGLLGAVLRAFEQQAGRRGHGDGAPLLRILADEAAQLAPLARLPSHLAVSAGWGVRWCLIYQSLAQIEHRYGREADALLGNVLCKLFLGPIQDGSTRTYLSDLLDEETVTASSWSAGPLGGGAVGGRTQHERQAPKVSAQRLMQLREGEAVLVHGRDLPAVVRLRAFWEGSRR